MELVGLRVQNEKGPFIISIWPVLCTECAHVTISGAVISALIICSVIQCFSVEIRDLEWLQKANINSKSIIPSLEEFFVFLEHVSIVIFSICRYIF